MEVYENASTEKSSTGGGIISAGMENASTNSAGKVQAQ